MVEETKALSAVCVNWWTEYKMNPAVAHIGKRFLSVHFTQKTLGHSVE